MVGLLRGDVDGSYAPCWQSDKELSPTQFEIYHP
jgi:hypothetical protein